MTSCFSIAFSLLLLSTTLSGLRTQKAFIRSHISTFGLWSTIISKLSSKPMSALKSSLSKPLPGPVWYLWEVWHWWNLTKWAFIFVCACTHCAFQTVKYAVAIPALNCNVSRLYFPSMVSCLLFQFWTCTWTISEVSEEKYCEYLWVLSNECPFDIVC